MSKRDGMTLIELVVALAVGGIVLVAAGALLRGLTHVRTTFARTEQGIMRDRNSRNILRQFGRSAIISDSGFVRVTDSTVTFPTSCLEAEGWQTKCTVTISATHGEDANGAFQIRTSTGFAFSFLHGEGHVRFLRSVMLLGEWTTAWTDSSRLPLGMELRAGRDSMFIRFPASVQ